MLRWHSLQVNVNAPTRYTGRNDVGRIGVVSEIESGTGTEGMTGLSNCNGPKVSNAASEANSAAIPNNSYFRHRTDKFFAIVRATAKRIMLACLIVNNAQAR